MSSRTEISDLQTDPQNLQNDDQLKVVSGGQLSVEGTAVQVDSNSDDVRVRVQSGGSIDGTINGVNFQNGGESSGRLVNFGQVSSDSRAVNIGGDNIAVVNYGDIIGTGDQRNGTIYSDGSANNFLIANARSGRIDAGENNQGAAISLQTGETPGEAIQASLFNSGVIQGRGQAAADSPLAGDGIRIFPGNGQAVFQGQIRNQGQILSESTQGPTGAIRLSDGLSFQGNISNGRRGQIAGVNNGLYVGNAEHDLTIRNAGRISSDSRAVNLDGSGVRLFNNGEIVGTGNQRNGTVYSDATADDYLINNSRRGSIDAGRGNQGAGIALQTGDVAGDVVTANIQNSGVIQGRGQGDATSGLAGDGIRIFSGVAGESTVFSGNIQNTGTIRSESTQGPTGGIRLSDGLGFDGNIVNSRRGKISGVNNGLYVGNAEHDLTIQNSGLISSESRAVNIDGTGVSLNNNGVILGTGNQRNGTVYSDATADDYRIKNTGVIDAGRGNQGAGIALQTGDVAGDVVTANIQNSGVIQGRGQGDATSGLAGDGIRIFSGVAGESTVFSGNIQNTGAIRSESTQGPTGGIRLSDGLGFDGNIVNGRRGQISGVNNGLYVGNAEHDLTIRNSGLISSESRAVNIDGSGVSLINDGVILGTGNQRNGTVYSDATADDFSIVNGRRGVIDAGSKNQGAAISLQIGDQADDVVQFSLRNDGRLRGRGDAANESPLAGDGIRLFSGVSDASVTAEGNIQNFGAITGSNNGIDVANGVTPEGSIRNFGSITATGEAGVFIDGEITGSVINRGTIRGSEAAIDARDSEAGVTVFNTGRLSGDVYLSEFDDVLNSARGVINGDLFGLDGNDQLTAGRGHDWISGGAGDDTLTGNQGADIFVFEQNEAGADIITDFENRRDRIDISDFNLGTGEFQDVLQNAQQNGGDILLTLQPNQTVLLQNTSLNNLDASDFIR